MTRDCRCGRGCVGALLVLCLLHGCGDGSSTDSDAASTGDAMGGGIAPGEPCTSDEQCAEPDAICRQGDICTMTLGPDAFEQECARGEAASCPGQFCIGLQENMQGKTGICSMPCDEDPEDCGADAACALLAGRNVCLGTCSVSADCANGFVCVDDPEGTGRACLVEPL